MGFGLFLEPMGLPRGLLEDGFVTCWLVEAVGGGGGGGGRGGGGVRWEEDPMWWSSEETESELAIGVGLLLIVMIQVWRCLFVGIL